MRFSRRELLQSSAAAMAGIALPTTLSAIEPIQRVGPSNIRLSLAAYSFRQWLDLKKKTMTLFDFIDLAATLPLDAVELTSYYFENTAPEYLAALKGRCTRLGLDVSGTTVGNNFCIADADKLKETARICEEVGRTHFAAWRQDNPYFHRRRQERRG